MAAYAYACAKAGSKVNWLLDLKLSQACKNTNYGQCPFGLQYNDCTTNYLLSCRHLALFQNDNRTEECVQGKTLIKNSTIYSNYTMVKLSEPCKFGYKSVFINIRSILAF